MSIAADLTRAETLKMRRRRGLVALSLAMAPGLITTMFAYRALRHAADPAVYGPAGGLQALENATDLLFLLAGVVGAMGGATAAAAELEQPIFRDLAATGRSRVALALAKLPGALAVTVPVLLAASVLSAGFTVLLHGALPAPSPGAVAQRVAAVVLAGVAATAVGLAAGAVGGARGGAIAAVLLLWLPVSQILLHADALGTARRLIPLAALGSAAGDDGYPVTMPATTAVLILALWAACGTAVAVWALRRREL